MGYAELIGKLQALPVDKRAEVFDFVEFLITRYKGPDPQPVTGQDGGEWTDASFSDFSMGQALRGMEGDPVTYNQGDLRERWQ
jgi:hypothetical protein